MTSQECEQCPVKDLQKIHRLLEKRALEKIPEEVREPLLEAKKQLKLVVQGFIGHALEEDRVCSTKHQAKSRRIKLE